MPLLIRNGGGPLIPGGIRFKDSRTGKNYDDTHTMLDDRVKEVIRDRLANPHLYPTTEPHFMDVHFVTKQISDYNCQRLGNDPKYCESLATNPAPGIVGKCSNCGGELSERICSTCSGRRVIGYSCNQCHRNFDR